MRGRGNYLLRYLISFFLPSFSQSNDIPKVYKLDKERLYVTYFEGNKGANLDPDNEARQIWLKYLPEARVLPYGMKENFWEMVSIWLANTHE